MKKLLVTRRKLIDKKANDDQAREAITVVSCIEVEGEAIIRVGKIGTLCSIKELDEGVGKKLPR